MNTTEQEQMLMGMMLNQRGAYEAVSRILGEEDITDPCCRRIWRCIDLLDQRGQAIDPAGIYTVITEVSPTTMADDMQRCIQWQTACASTLNMVPLAEHLSEEARSRRLHTLLTDIHQQNEQRLSSCRNLIATLEQRLTTLLPRHENHSPRPLSEVVQETRERLSRRQTDIDGLRTGFPLLDKTLGGLHDTDLIVIGARPGDGKTTFGLNLLLGLAHSGYPCAMFSIEMAGWQIARKVISRGNEAEVPVYLSDHPTLDLPELRRQARRLVQEQGVRCILVDYLQLLKTGEPTHRNTTREQEVSKVSGALKALAKELNIVVVALCQLNRAVEQRKQESRRPLLSDLRESGAIEQDADIVLFLDPKAEGTLQWSNDKRAVTLIIAKHRNGQLRDIPFVFTPARSLFQEFAQSSEGMLNFEN